MPHEDGAAPHRERLTPSAGAAAVAVGSGMACGLVVTPISAWLGLGTALGCAAAFLLALVLTSPEVAVVAGGLRAGRAFLPADAVGAVTVLEGQQWRRARGPDLDARAFLCLRDWIRGGVRIEVRDATDPTPYWLVSSRRPAALLAALQVSRPGCDVGDR